MDIQQIVSALLAFNSSLLQLQNVGLITEENKELLDAFYTDVVATLGEQDITVPSFTLVDKAISQFEKIALANSIPLPTREGKTLEEYRDALALAISELPNFPELP